MPAQRPLLFLMVLLSLAIPHQSVSAEDEPPNIIFVILDDLRFDGMGFLTLR